jgi:hypothetical protein
MADYNTFSLYSLPILFGIFPWTKDFAGLFWLHLKQKHYYYWIWNYLPNLITILVIIFVFRYVLKGIHFLKDK